MGYSFAVGGGDKLHSYRYAFNGFAGELSPAAVARLAHRPEVIGIWPDSTRTLETNNASIFLGLLDQNGGLRADLGLTGEDVVVGVIDSGIDLQSVQFEGRIDPASADTAGNGTLDDVSGHGTGVADILAARRDGIGTHGVAFDATLVIYRTDFPNSCARGESSMRERRSSFTTSSSRRKSSSGHWLLAKRSASSFITSSSRAEGICW